jgi:hypothetical protein
MYATELLHLLARPKAMADTISNADKLACVERELKLRRMVYVKLVTAGRMTPEKADHEFAVMSAIVDDYRRLVEPELLL